MQYKRLLAGILSLAMLCSMASTPAYAVEDAVQSDNTAVVSEEQNPETDIAEIPETFRNYSLTAQTQTSRGNPAHPAAAGTAASADAVIPQTGDASRPLVWGVLLALSGLALAGLTVCRKRKSR